MLSVESMCWLLIYYWQPGKKWALTKAYRFTLKPEKLLLNPEGCSYRRLCKQGNEGRKKKEENCEQRALRSKKLLLTTATTSREHCSSSSFVRRLCKCIPFFKQNLLTDLELRPFLSWNLSFSNKLTSECVFRWVITRSFMQSFMYGKVTTR